jgi:hypothetical protein
MSVTYNPLFVLRSCHSASKWCRRRLKRNEHLQLYGISDSVLKQLKEETSIALLNVQGLTQLKMLHRGIEALFYVLPGGRLMCLLIERFKCQKAIHRLSCLRGCHSRGNQNYDLEDLKT